MSPHLFFYFFLVVYFFSNKLFLCPPPPCLHFQSHSRYLCIQHIVQFAKSKWWSLLVNIWKKKLLMFVYECQWKSLYEKIKLKLSFIESNKILFYILWELEKLVYYGISYNFQEKVWTHIKYFEGITDEI